jgi:methionine-rich copper-binding protein CopC
MRKLSSTLLALGAALAATFLVVSVASAHAPIKFIHWDSQTNPTSLTAMTDNRTITTTPGSFYLRVYNAGGSRIDNGDAKVGADQMSITVTLIPGLTAGTYRVDWLTTSTDGAVLSSSVSVTLPESNGGAVAPPPDPDGGADDADTAAPAATEAPPTTSTHPVTPPSAGDAGLASHNGGNSDALFVLAGTLAMLTAGGVAFAGRKR